MADQWLYTRSGNQFGPISAVVLKQLAKARELAPSDLVSKVGTQRWVLASRVKGLFPAMTRPLPPDSDELQGDDQPMSDAVSTQPRSDQEANASAGEGQIELDAASRFLWTQPLGLPTWIVFVALGTYVLNVMLEIKDMGKSGREGHMPELLIAIMDGTVVVFGLIMYFGMWANLGKQTACPRCKTWYSKLLIKSDAVVIDSTDEERTYIGQAAIRDSNFRVTGYLDEQRSKIVTVKTILADRKY
jgi:GYF domain 2